MHFRSLRPDEIEVRVSKINEKGCMLLLYKDARCDMNILDEIVGSERWQRKHYECKGNLFCSVGICIDNHWIWKDDCGAESSSEAQKGEASDSFKRACFNWGIGRELYTSPFIWVSADKVKLIKNNGKYTTYDKFHVSAIYYDDKKKISILEIKNEANIVVYRYSNQKKNEKENLSQVKVVQEQTQQKIAISMHPNSTQDIGKVCSQCQKTITEKVYQYSIQKFGKSLCMDCQKQLK